MGHFSRFGAFAAIISGVVLLQASQANAAVVAPGFNSNVLGANDDGFAGPVDLPFAANFFGTTYSSLYVNNNGNLTFNQGQGTYTPFGIGAGYTGQPIIAPFFADIDTRGAGSGLVTYGNGTYAGHTAFGANYPDVGYFGSHTDKLNDFQVILVDRGDVGAGDFDIYFNYDQIQFETGDASGGRGGLGGTSATVGYSAGTGDPGSYYEFPGSRVPGSFIDGGTMPLVSTTNDGVPGQFLFQVRNGTVMSPVPLPASAPMFGAALVVVGAVGYGMKRKKAIA